MRWLCIHLPLLPLEVFSRGLDRSPPLVIQEGVGRVARVLACDAAAAAAGIQPGMTAGAVHALCDRVRVQGRDRRLERQALERLAAWAGQFTSTLSLEPPAGLLLEVEGSERLFGGLASLVERVRQGVAALGYTARLAVAPTPLAALWLARAGRECLVRQPGRLVRALAGIPVEQIEPDPGARARLHGLGVHRLGDCLRLPTEGLARRFGPDFCRRLDRALGRVPDPRLRYRPPLHFLSRLQLPVAVEAAPALAFAVQRQLGELTGMLRARDAAVQRLELRLCHASGRATAIQLGMVAPCRDGQHLLGLVRVQLERLVLPEPVVALELESRRLQPAAPDTRPLFPLAPGRDTGGGPLLDRLQARLGRGRIQGLRWHADHRPERAHVAEDFPPPATRPPAAACLRRDRPCWLLVRPRRLVQRPAGPELPGRGPLRLLSAPERIETGWWDGADVRRDYYLGEDRAGRRYWVYRALDDGAWYLHGLFD